MAALGAAIVGEENETGLADALEQDETAARFSFRRNGGENHGVGLDDDARVAGFLEPKRELAKGIGVEIGLGQAALHVVAAKRGDFLIAAVFGHDFR